MDKLQNPDELFALARNGATVQSFDDTQKLFLSSLTLNGNVPASKKVFTLKNWIIMLTTISAITCTILFLNHGNELKSEKQIQKKEQQLTVAATNPEDKGIVNPKVNRTQTALVKVLDIFENQLAKIGSEIENPPMDELKTPFYWTGKIMDDTPYEFPKLTEKEIEATRKKKKSMLKALQKYDKNAYAYVPSGTFIYDSTTVSVQAFYMSKTEVTNFEYRTFLFDLLLQDRKSEFLIAKPNQAGWIALGAGGKAYQDHYFSHEAYNEYPVVNVSKEGVELYCKWLSEELHKFVGEKKEGNYNDIRLPLRIEWVKAASVEGKQFPYPWNGPYVRNSQGLYQANFKNDTIAESNVTYVSNDLTAPSKSYWPNNLGLYNMSGNVAEMVYEDLNKSEMTSAGGSWRNTAAEIQINAPDTRTNVAAGAADIGFRVVCTFLKQ